MSKNLRPWWLDFRGLKGTAFRILLGMFMNASIVKGLGCVIQSISWSPSLLPEMRKKSYVPLDSLMIPYFKLQHQVSCILWPKELNRFCWGSSGTPIQYKVGISVIRLSQECLWSGKVFNQECGRGRIELWHILQQILASTTQTHRKTEELDNFQYGTWFSWTQMFGKDHVPYNFGGRWAIQWKVHCMVKFWKLWRKHYSLLFGQYEP